MLHNFIDVCYNRFMQRRKVKVIANAKVNFSLNITGTQNNMHTLDMILASIDLSDVVTVCERFDEKVIVEYSDKRIEVGEDSVSKAIELVRERIGKIGIEVFVQKNIPFCGGLGGSSADAAGALLALDKLYGLREKGVKMDIIASKVGSDVWYMMHGGFARVQGVGDKLDFFAAKVPLYLVVVQGEGGVLSGDSYREFDRMFESKVYKPTDTETCITALKNFADPAKILPHMNNALQKPSIALNPTIQSTLIHLEKAGAQKAMMTGSGSACIGIFENTKDAETAAKKLSKLGLYAVATKTI